MGFEAVVGYLVVLSVPIWLTVEQVASLWFGRRESTGATSGHRRAAEPAPATHVATRARALSGKAA
jgi:hypothetical protein